MATDRACLTVMAVPRSPLPSMGAPASEEAMCGAVFFPALLSALHSAAASCFAMHVCGADPEWIAFVA